MIYVVGLPKTGTTSMRKALEVLGLKKGVDFECGDYVHFRKWDADKYILTLRESEEVWYDSLVRWAEKKKDDKKIRAQRKKMYGAEMPNDSFKEKYLDHITRCAKECDELLIFITGRDGWGLLCDWLGKEIPDVPFPHKNKNESTSIKKQA